MQSAALLNQTVRTRPAPRRTQINVADQYTENFFVEYKYCEYITIYYFWILKAFSIKLEQKFHAVNCTKKLTRKVRIQVLCQSGSGSSHILSGKLWLKFYYEKAFSNLQNVFFYPTESRKTKINQNPSLGSGKLLRLRFRMSGCGDVPNYLSSCCCTHAPGHNYRSCPPCCCLSLMAF
jgi:hypothetical protein